MRYKLKQKKDFFQLNMWAEPELPTSAKMKIWKQEMFFGFFVWFFGFFGMVIRFWFNARRILVHFIQI